MNDTLSHMQTAVNKRGAFTSEKNKLENFLKETGLQVSTGRAAVFKEVFDSHGHFTAEGLVKACRRHRTHASRATIYRCLKEMLEAGVIRKTAFGEKHDCYEHVYDEKPHHHARCIHCFTLIEFPDLKEDRIYVPFLEKKQFKILGHEMHFYGICRRCQTGQSRLKWRHHGKSGK